MNFLTEWNVKHFEEVDKTVVELAEKLLENNMISSVEINENNALEVSFPQMICKGITSLTFIDYYSYFIRGLSGGYNSFAIPKYDGVDLSNTVCSRNKKGEGCQFNTCPFIVGAYLKFLQDKDEGKIDELLSNHKAILELSLESKVEDIIVSEDIKKKMYEVLRHLRFLKNNKDKGIKLQKTKFAFAFLGNSGTGKNEVAKLLSEMFYKMGYYPKDFLHVIEYDMILTKNELEKKFENAKNRVLMIKGIDGVDITSVGSQSRDQRDKADVLSQMVLKYSNTCTIILSGEKTNVLSYIASQKSMRKVFQNHIYFEDLTNKSLYNLFRALCNRQGYRIEDNFEDEFYKYVEAHKKQSAFENGEFVEDMLKEMLINESLLPDKIYSDKIIKKDYLPEKITIHKKNVETYLNDLVGMKDIKKKVSDLKAFLIFNKKIKALNNPSLPLNLHMMFQGNPGTGKTTVARVITEILYDLGYIKENKLIEVERKDLIAEYVGQTAIKTGKVIQSAKGGVLFIDEAYSITNESRGGYGDECIATLIKAMEDHKEDLVVIFAGYNKEMKQFINSNSGLSSRIGNVFDFEDYSSEELLEIFKNKVKKYGYKLEVGVCERVENHLIEEKKVKNFGNGRFVDNLIQDIILIHAVNTQNTDDKDKLLTITEEDIPEIREIKNDKGAIGFLL